MKGRRGHNDCFFFAFTMTMRISNAADRELASCWRIHGEYMLDPVLMQARAPRISLGER